MKITLTAFVTLDGVHQGPGAPGEDTRDGFTHGGWSVPYGDDDFLRFVVGVFENADAFLLGRRTYEIFAGHWPRVTDPADPIATMLNSLPKYVASSTLGEPSWADTTVLRRNAVAEIAELKRQPGRELQIHGSAELARSLLGKNLIDTLHLAIFPVVLGSGRRLFESGVLPGAFRLEELERTGAGVVLHTYAASGRPEYGSYALGPEQD